MKEDELCVGWDFEVYVEDDGGMLSVRVCVWDYI